MKNYVSFCAHLVSNLLNMWKMFGTKAVERSQTHISFAVHFTSHSYGFRDNIQKESLCCVISRTQKLLDWFWRSLHNERMRQNCYAMHAFPNLFKFLIVPSLCGSRYRKDLSNTYSHSVVAFHRNGECRNQVNNYQVLMENLAPWNWLRCYFLSVSLIVWPQFQQRASDRIEGRPIIRNRIKMKSYGQIY
jgi:hypothetical protein